MANDARLGREAVLVPHGDDTTEVEVRLGREAVGVAHVFPTTDVTMRMARLGVIVAITRPHGWDIHDDPAL